MNTSFDPDLFDLDRPKIPSRVKFADEIEPGDVIIEACGFPRCGSDATQHVPLRPHQLTVERLRVTDGTVTAIVVDEDGGQQPWTAAASKPVQLRDDTAEPAEDAVTSPS